MRKTKMNDREWLEKIVVAANAYCNVEGSNEEEIDKFITFIFKSYGYAELLKRLQKERQLQRG